MKIGIVGCGAMGSVYGGLFTSAGNEVWWGPPFDQTDNLGPGHVGWGFPGCPSLSVYDRNGDGAIEQ